MRAFHRLVVEIWESRLPVVAAVSGVAYGGGVNLALACDLVVCSEDARFCQVFVRRGVVPDVGGAWLLPRLVGMQRAKELMLLAPVIDARHAERLGLTNAVEPDADAALERAVALAGQLAGAAAVHGRALEEADQPFRGRRSPGSLEREAVTQAAALRSRPAVEGFEAFRKGARAGASGATGESSEHRHPAAPCGADHAERVALRLDDEEIRLRGVRRPRGPVRGATCVRAGSGRATASRSSRRTASSTSSRCSGPGRPGRSASR